MVEPWDSRVAGTAYRTRCCQRRRGDDETLPSILNGCGTKEDLETVLLERQRSPSVVTTTQKPKSGVAVYHLQKVCSRVMPRQARARVRHAWRVRQAC